MCMAFVPSHIRILKILVLLKRILRPIFFRKTIEHALPFFVKSNCLENQNDGPVSSTRPLKLKISVLGHGWSG